jgi:tRNA-dihydrouridine synthase B
MTKKKMNNFWNKLNKPFYVLAPMAGITDSAFRQICKEFGADVVYSEMASVTALVYNPGPTLEMLKFDKKERPYVVQLFGSNPDYFAQAVKLVTKKIKPDGIDINFGCPVKKVQKQGAGAVLMNDLQLAHQIIETTIKNTNLPVSIKCRSKVGEVDVLNFLSSVKDLDIKAVMIHGRTLAQGHSGSVDFAIIKKVRQLVRGALIANGGVKDFVTVQEMLEKTGADGIGIGQGALGKPWVFRELTSPRPSPKLGGGDIFKIALQHAKLAYELKGEQGIIEMRKHLCWYVAGLTNARELRRELVKVKTINEIQRIL